MVTLRAPGLCTITADQAGNGNTGAAPQVTQVTQSFAVEAASQTIAFAALPDRTMGDAVMLSATASSGLAVGFASMTGAVCSVADVTVTLLAPGICTIAANQGGDGYYGAAAQVTQSFAVGAGEVQVYYIHSDHLNTPRMITDAGNTPVWEWKNSDPFGANLPEENPSALGVFTYNPRFAGQYFDRETGLHQNWFRDYDPATGRYVQSDPIGLDGGVNTFSYVSGNPVTRIDPLGLCDPCEAAKKALGDLWKAQMDASANETFGGTLEKLLAGLPVEGVALGVIGAVKGVTSGPSMTNVIKGIKQLPEEAVLTEQQISMLSQNVDLLLNKSLPALIESGNVSSLINTFTNDARFKFIDQIPGALEKINKALENYFCFLPRK